MPISFAFIKLLSLLVYPLTQFFLLQLAALLVLLRGWRRSGILLLLTGLCWCYLASTAVFGGWLMQRLEAPYPPVAATDLPAADAIVLLGGGVHSRKSAAVLGNLNRWSDRLLFSAALFKAGKAPVIVLSGGGPAGQPTEAQLSLEILQVMGVPAGSMLMEEASRDTHGNALYTVPLLRERDLRKVLLVTSAFHMRRAQALFAAQGMAVIPAPTDHHTGPGEIGLRDWFPTLEGLTLTHYALHERAGYEIYRLRDWL